MDSQGLNASSCGQRRLLSDWAESSLRAPVVLLVLSCGGLFVTLIEGEIQIFWDNLSSLVAGPGSSVDACPPGIQTLAGSIRRSGKSFFRGD